MSLRLTPDVLAAAYDFLRTTKPFVDWKLPESDELGFAVTRHGDRFSHMIGHARSSGADIAVSERKVGSTRVLIEVMAHECIHLHQHLMKSETPNTQHNAEFDRLAKCVCKTHGFDYKSFT